MTQLVDIWTPPAETFTAIVTHRTKTQFGRPRVYLYTQDEELILAGELFGIGHTKFRVSRSSSNLDKEKNPEFYIGTVERSVIQRTWHMTIEHTGTPQEILRVKYLLRKEKSSRDRVMVVTTIDKQGNASPALEQQVFEETFPQEFPDIPLPAPNPQKNFFLTTPEGKHAFSFAEVAEDEYHFSVSAPLNVLQAFGIALTIFYPIDAEQ